MSATRLPKRTLLKTYMLVGDANEMCDVIVIDKESLGPLLYDCHTTLLKGLCGRHSADAMYEVLANKYAYVTRDLCAAFVTCCPDSIRAENVEPQKADAGHTPISSKRAMERVQIDLICLSSADPERNEDYKYILTVKDHFTGFVWLFGMKTKQRHEVVHHLRSVFTWFDVPQIIQADNGSEFKGLAISPRDLENSLRAKAKSSTWAYDLHPLGGDTVRELKQMFPDTILIHGRVRGSSTQGSVERANRDVQRYLWEACLVHNATHPEDAGKWSIHLQNVNRMMNGRSNQSRGKISPFELMFMRVPSQRLASIAELDDTLREQMCRWEPF